MLLAGDIGGTKTELALFSIETGPHFPVSQRKVHSADYPSLEAIVKDFLAAIRKPVEEACFAVAGPVIGGRVKTTNLPWVIDETSLGQALNLNSKAVHLINDLEAMARAVPLLRSGDIQTINTGEPVLKGALCVIAPGTGLGESFLTWDESRYIAHSSEGGHADFAPTGERQIHLPEYMLTQFDHVSVEHVCSGLGIPNIYRYLRDVEGIPEPPEVATLIASAGDPSVAIIHFALGSKNQSNLCQKTIEMFVSILASEAANLAMKVLATGGVYMAGGVVVHLLSAIQKTPFMEAFKRKERFAELMSRIPIHIIVSYVGLTGAAACGLEKLKASR